MRNWISVANVPLPDDVAEEALTTIRNRFRVVRDVIGGR